MTKNSGRKKAARRYQQEHPGTTFPEAMRATARISAEEPEVGYPHSLPTELNKPNFDRIARVARKVRWNPLFDGDEEQWLRDRDASLSAEINALKLVELDTQVVFGLAMLKASREGIRSELARVDRARRKPRRILGSDKDIEVGLRRLGGIEFDETEYAQIAGWDGFGTGEFAEQQGSAWRAFAESRRGQQEPSIRLMRHNGLMHLMTTHTVEDDSAT